MSSDTTSPVVSFIVRVPVIFALPVSVIVYPIVSAGSTSAGMLVKVFFTVTSTNCVYLFVIVTSAVALFATVALFSTVSVLS